MHKIKPTDKDALAALKSDKYGSWSDPIKITWFHILLYAQLTRDFQWIHVNPWKARKGPFGRVVAHGGLVYAMLNRLSRRYLSADIDSTRVLDLSKDKVRSPNPVRLGERIHLRYRVVATYVKDSMAIVDYEVQIGIVGIENEKEEIALECRAKLSYM